MNNKHEMILNARTAIGVGDSDRDWKIVPSEHAKMFEKKASSLAENLRGSRSQGLAEIYEEWNEKAIRARDNFKNTVALANIAIFCTVSFGSLLLVASGLEILLGNFGVWLVRGIGILGIFSSGLAAMWLAQVRGGDLAKRWAKFRAKAEINRLNYFKAVIAGALVKTLDRLLVLEYTRRFLLDNQIEYFKGRGKQHENAANSTLKSSTRAVFISSLFTAIAGLLSMWHSELATAAGLGVIASAYSAFLLSRSAVNQDRTNADRYLAAEYQLKERRLDIDTYRERTASGDKRAVQEFFAPIFIILESDHQAFLSEAEKRESTIDDLETRLDTTRKALEGEESENSNI